MVGWGAPEEGGAKETPLSAPSRQRPIGCHTVFSSMKDAIDVTGADGDVAALEVLAAENVKRVVRAREDRSPWEIASFMELKTVWHPIGR